MAEKLPRPCPECGETGLVPAEPIDRRGALKLIGAGAASIALAGSPLAQGQDEKPGKKPNRKAEGLIKELYGSLSADQKKVVVSPHDDPRRLKFFNRALGTPIGKAYTKPQQELVERILRAISSGDEVSRTFPRTVIVRYRVGVGPSLIPFPFPGEEPDE